MGDPVPPSTASGETVSSAVYQNILHIFARVLAIFPDPPLRFEVGAVVVMMES